MICPNCGKNLEFLPYVLYNAQAYRKEVLGRALCCGKGVSVRPVISFELAAYAGCEDADDWGVKFNKDQDHGEKG